MDDRQEAQFIGLLALILGTVSDGWIAGVWFLISIACAVAVFAFRWLDRQERRLREQSASHAAARRRAWTN